jgi:hypothetical protein
VLSDGTDVKQLVLGQQLPGPLPPDLFVLGKDVIVLPGIGKMLMSPFFVGGKSALEVMAAEDRAFGTALVMLLWALDWIQLGVMPWQSIAADALGLSAVAESTIPGAPNNALYQAVAVAPAGER